MNNNALNEVKVTGTVVSKVIKSELKDNKFICSFIFKLLLKRSLKFNL